MLKSHREIGLTGLAIYAIYTEDMDLGLFGYPKMFVMCLHFRNYSDKDLLTVVFKIGMNKSPLLPSANTISISKPC